MTIYYDLEYDHFYEPDKVAHINDDREECKYILLEQTLRTPSEYIA